MEVDVGRIRNRGRSCGGCLAPTLTHERKAWIDLASPNGNAWVLMYYAVEFAKQLGLDAQPICQEMMSGDYNHLLRVLVREFGDYIELERRGRRVDVSDLSRKD